ncbi:MAG: TIGR04222 domain-containing membrane protein [Isosphaeraceae bacterium]
MDWLLNLKGPEFLQLYLGLIGLATAAALFIRWRFRQPSDDAWIEGAPLDPYEVAYLKGGRVLAVNAALAGLVHRGELTVDAGNRKLRPVSAPGPEAYELERAVYQEAEAADGDVKELHKQDRELTDALPTRLIDEGLICADDTAERVRWGSVIPLAVVLVVGCLKIIVGMQRHRPVALLVILCVATGIMALAFLSKRPHRTRRGSRLLARLGRENAALHDTAITLRGRSGLKPKDVALAVGLYGAGVMANGSLSELKQLLKPPGGGGGCGSGCGSGCGGGGGCGGCGGGCGGCGG